MAGVRLDEKDPIDVFPSATKHAKNTSMRLTVIIKTEPTKQTLSRFGGLALTQRVIQGSGIKEMIEPFLPTEGFVHNRSTPVQKFLGLVTGFIAGADCLEDLDVLSQDAGFEAAAGKTISSNRYSEFLAAFDPKKLRELNGALIKTSLEMRRLTHGLGNFHLIIDSTKHEQFGLKQEGVEYSYTKVRCLDSLQAYDEHGYSYWHALRPGSTNTSVGSTEVISAVLSQLPSEAKRYVLADSGYYGTEFFNACMLQSAKFIVATRENVYARLLEKQLNWKRAKNMSFFDGREFEYAETINTHVGLRGTLRVVLVRALKADHAAGLHADADYDYAAFTTNIGMHEMKATDVLRKYRKRSNAENFIREMKNGVDTNRFQCRRLISNGAFGLAAAFAHTILRFVAQIADKTLVQFAKRLRNRLINLPCMVVTHARQVTFRMSEAHNQEVRNWLKKYHDIKLLHATASVKSSPPLFLN